MCIGYGGACLVTLSVGERMSLCVVCEHELNMHVCVCVCGGGGVGVGGGWGG